MEELFAAGILGGVVVILAAKSNIFKKAAKGVIKTGYAAADMVSSGAGETMESLKDLMAESKAEYEAVKASKAEAKVQA